MTHRGERAIWQRWYWEHTIRNEWDFAAHMDYRHFNPADWPRKRPASGGEIRNR
jgi:hypothetical protein